MVTMNHVPTMKRIEQAEQAVKRLEAELAAARLTLDTLREAAGLNIQGFRPPRPVPDEAMSETIFQMCFKKKRYRSVEAAGQAAEAAHQKGSEDNLRIYICPACDGFHLTKNPGV